MGMLRAWAPYLLVAAFLVITRVPALGIKDLLRHGSVTFTVENLFGAGLASKSFQPLYLPGTIFVLVSLITFFLHRMNASAYKSAWAASGRTMITASVALVFTVPMVQVFLNSDGGLAGLEKMPIALADGVAHIAQSAWPIFSR